MEINRELTYGGCEARFIAAKDVVYDTTGCSKRSGVVRNEVIGDAPEKRTVR